MKRQMCSGLKLNYSDLLAGLLGANVVLLGRASSYNLLGTSSFVQQPHMLFVQHTL